MPELIETAADIVAAYVSNNPVPSGGLGDLIASVHAALTALSKPVPEPAPPPAVNPKKSIFADYLISLEDGKKYKILKTHLRKLGMTPGQYRAKWSLPDDYPVVAPGYSAQRSNIATSIGLGRKRRIPQLDGKTVAPPDPDGGTV